MLKHCVEKVLFASRWILAIVYVGMSFTLIGLAYIFFKDVIFIFMHLNTLDETDFILEALGLVDILLVGGLIMMVMFSSYENFVSRMNTCNEKQHLDWLGKLGMGALKLKMAGSIVAISSIFLLKKYVRADEILKGLPADATLFHNPLFWYTAVHIVFVLSAFLMTIMERSSSQRS